MADQNPAVTQLFRERDAAHARVEAAEAEVRALRAAVRYLSKVADRGGPSNWRDFIAHPEVADAIRAATADPTPVVDDAWWDTHDNDEHPDYYGRAATADPTPEPETHDG